MHTLQTSWILRYTLLLCMGFMMSFSLSSQITLTPRVSYTSNKYRVGCGQVNNCNSRSKSIGLGIHSKYAVYKELNVVADFNSYINRLPYLRFSREMSFNYYDFKVGLSNDIINERTTFGIGLQCEILYNIEEVKSGIISKFDGESRYGVEFSVNHSLGKFEFFVDLYYNLNSKNSTIWTVRQNNIQLGLGFPISVKF